MTADPSSAAAGPPILIGVIGDSLSLPRHFDGIGFHQTYAFRLAEWWRQQGRPAYVWPVSRAGVPIAELLRAYQDVRPYLGPARPGIALVQIGIVDCAPRPLPYRLRALLGRLPWPVRAPIVAFLHDNRSALLRAGLSFRFTSPAAFARHLGALLDLAAQDFDRVYVVNIAPPGAENARRSPGLAESIPQYNRVIAAAAAGRPEVSLVDVWTEFSRSSRGLDAFVSPADGHHLTFEGHRRIAEILAEREAALGRRPRGGTIQEDFSLRQGGSAAPRSGRWDREGRDRRSKER